MRRAGTKSGALARYLRLGAAADSLFTSEVAGSAFEVLERQQNSRSRLLPGRPDLLRETALNLQFIGDAGSGKSTLLRRIAFEEASAGARVPLLASLATARSETSIEDLLVAGAAKRGLAAERRYFQDLFRRGRALVLLDGLDEGTGARVRLPDEILQFMRDYPETQVVVSSRPWAAMPASDAFISINVLPMSKTRVRQFYSRWFQGQPSAATEVLAHLDGFPDLYRAVASPLIATVLAVLKQKGVQLPRTVPAVYAERLRLLLDTWDAAKGIRRDKFAVSDKEFLLRKLAFSLHSRGARTTSHAELVALIRARIQAARTSGLAESFAVELVRHNNVLFPEPQGAWTLGHLQFQEHLCAAEALENPSVRLVDHLGDGWWSKVLELYALLTLDIGPLIETARSKGVLTAHVAQLVELLPLAPNTGLSSRAQVERLYEEILSVDASFRRHADHEILAGKGRPRGV